MTGKPPFSKYFGVPLDAQGAIGRGLGIVCDAQNEMWLVTLRDVVSEVSASYIAAARLLGKLDDPLVDCLIHEQVFDARLLWDAHSHLARYWREVISEGYLYQCGCTGKHVADWQVWVEREAALWGRYAPAIARAVCQVIVFDRTSEGMQARGQLVDHLRHQYPLAGVRRSAPA